MKRVQPKETDYYRLYWQSRFTGVIGWGLAAYPKYIIEPIARWHNKNDYIARYWIMPEISAPARFFNWLKGIFIMGKRAKRQRQRLYKLYYASIETGIRASYSGLHPKEDLELKAAYLNSKHDNLWFWIEPGDPEPPDWDYLEIDKPSISYN